ncbi:hypothetical protein CTAYLR_007541 [Chrysophaeum taylorii]|uniref:Formin-like protein n=1 Tax=Chrysophaeum taylorii TaxID=2483200 RepID=A0AAD7U5P4_9STRA|nr:hypothetical protein CTAYLR_007541 [Chrysophaeum taylorii]
MSGDGYDGVFGENRGSVVEGACPLYTNRREMRGWLYKASGGRWKKHFDRRHFVMEVGRLRYWKDESKKSGCKGEILLQEIVEVVWSCRSDEKFPPAECRFEVRTRERDWCLAVAPDAMDAKREWVEALSAASGAPILEAGELSAWLWMRKAVRELGWKQRLVTSEGDSLRVYKTRGGPCVAEYGPLRSARVERTAASGRFASDKELVRFTARFGETSVEFACGTEEERDRWLSHIQEKGERSLATTEEEEEEEASCEIFVEHASFGFLRCARCGVPRASHWTPPEPCRAFREGWLRVGSRRHYARLAGSELRWFHSEAVREPEARDVVDLDAVLARDEDDPHLFGVATARRKLVARAESRQAREAWLAALLEAQRWARQALQWRIQHETNAPALRERAEKLPPLEIATEPLGGRSRLAALAQRLSFADPQTIRRSEGVVSRRVGDTLRRLTSQHSLEAADARAHAVACVDCFLPLLADSECALKLCARVFDHGHQSPLELLADYALRSFAPALSEPREIAHAAATCLRLAELCARSRDGHAAVVEALRSLWDPLAARLAEAEMVFQLADDAPLPFVAALVDLVCTVATKPPGSRPRDVADRLKLLAELGRAGVLGALRKLRDAAPHLEDAENDDDDDDDDGMMRESLRGLSRARAAAAVRAMVARVDAREKSDEREATARVRDAARLVIADPLPARVAALTAHLEAALLAEPNPNALKALLSATSLLSRRAAKEAAAAAAPVAEEVKKEQRRRPAEEEEAKKEACPDTARVDAKHPAALAQLFAAKRADEIRPPQKKEAPAALAQLFAAKRADEIRPPQKKEAPEAPPPPPEEEEEEEKKDDVYSKYRKLKLMGMPEPLLRLKIQAEGLDPAKVFGGGDSQEKSFEQKEDPRLEKYRRLKKMGLPEANLRLKMQAEGLDPAQLFEATPAAKEKEEALKPAALGASPSVALRPVWWTPLDKEHWKASWWAKDDDPSKLETARAAVVARLDRLEKSFAKAPAKVVVAAPKEKAPPSASALDPKRVQAVAVALRKLKEANLGEPEALASAVSASLSGDEMDEETINLVLRSVLPPSPEADDEELEAIRQAPNHRGDEEAFVLGARTLCPRLRAHLGLAKARVTCDERVADAAGRTLRMKCAVDAVQASETFKAILRLALFAGNALNHAAASRQAAGVKLEALDKLSAAKPSVPSFSSALDFVVQVASETPDCPDPLRLADELAGPLDAIRRDEPIDDVLQTLRADADLASSEDHLKPWAQSLRRRADDLERDRDEIDSRAKRLLLYYGEDDDVQAAAWFENLRDRVHVVDTIARDLEAAKRRRQKQSTTTKQQDDAIEPGLSVLSEVATATFRIVRRASTRPAAHDDAGLIDDLLGDSDDEWTTS